MIHPAADDHRTSLAVEGHSVSEVGRVIEIDCAQTVSTSERRVS